MRSGLIEVVGLLGVAHLGDHLDLVRSGQLSDSLELIDSLELFAVLHLALSAVPAVVILLLEEPVCHDAVECVVLGGPVRLSSWETVDI